MTNRSRITTVFSAPRIRLRRLVHNRIAALTTIVAINVLGISAPIIAQATPLVYQLCSDSSPLAVGTQPCLFGPTPGFEMDGNTPQDTAAGVDWGTAPFPYTPLATFPLVAGTGELDFAGGGKYSHPTFTPPPTQTPSGKDT